MKDYEKRLLERPLGILEKSIFLATIVSRLIVSSPNTLDNRYAILFILIISISGLSFLFKFIPLIFLSVEFLGSEELPTIMAKIRVILRSSFLILGFYVPIFIYCGYAFGSIVDQQLIEVSYPYDENLATKINEDLKKIELPSLKEEITLWPSHIGEEKILIVNLNKKELEYYSIIPPDRRPNTVTDATYIVSIIGASLQQIGDEVLYRKSLKGRTEVSRKPIFAFVYEVDVYAQKEGKLFYRKFLKKTNMDGLFSLDFVDKEILPSLGIRNYTTPWKGWSIENKILNDVAMLLRKLTKQPLKA